MEELSRAIATFEECLPLLIGTKDELSQKLALLAMENNDLDQVIKTVMQNDLMHRIISSSARINK